MKSLCFAFLMGQNSQQNLSPPSHIETLIKNRILHQLKKEDLDLHLYFDAPQCETIGTYIYSEDSMMISSNDNQLTTHLNYSNIIEGKTLDLDSIKQLIQNKKNITSLIYRESHDESSTHKKWIPWLLGSVVLGLTGVLIYNSSSSKKESSQKTRRYR